MKRVVCALCGGTGVSFEVPDPATVRPKTKIAALEKQLTFFPDEPTPEEEEAWKALENSSHGTLPPN